MLETLPNSNGQPVGLWRQSAGKERMMKKQKGLMEILKENREAVRLALCEIPISDDSGQLKKEISTMEKLLVRLEALQ